MKNSESPSVCMVANREIAPLLLALGCVFRSEGCRVVFLAADEWAFQLIRKNGFPAIKQPPYRKVFYRKEMFAYERISRMGAGFASIGFGSCDSWSRYFCRRSAYFKEWLDRSWALLRSDMLVVYNGVQFFEQIMADKFKAEGKTTWFIENGLFPKTAQLDPKGTNAYSSIADIPDGELAAGTPYNIVLSCLENLKKSHVELKESPPSVVLEGFKLGALGFVWASIRFLMFDAPFLFGEYLAKAPFFFRRAVQSEKKDLGGTSSLPERYVFFPLQVAADSQMIVHSEIGIEDGLRGVYEAVKTIVPPCRLVVKEHPLEKNVDYEALRRQMPDICWIRNVALQKVIERSICVVNFNSSVGLQALLFGKRVFCLGDALYARKGLAEPLPNPQALAGFVADLGEPHSNPKLVASFLYHLYTYHSVPYDRTSISWKDLEGMVFRMLGRGET